VLGDAIFIDSPKKQKEETFRKKKKKKKKKKVKVNKTDQSHAPGLALALVKSTHVANEKGGTKANYDVILI